MNFAVAVAFPGCVLRRFLPFVCVLVLSACASYPINEPLESLDTEVGYRLNNRALGDKNSDELYIILALSGGGTRAAALDYGVMKYLDELLDTKLPAIVITADRSPKLEEEARRNDYGLLRKPIKPAALRALMTNLMKSH